MTDDQSLSLRTHGLAAVSDRPLSNEALRISTVVLPSIPNARLVGEVPLATGTSAMGSSQLAGCPGDFCHYDLSFLTLDTGESYRNTQNDFRTKLMAADKSFLDQDVVIGQTSSGLSSANRRASQTRRSSLMASKAGQSSASDAANKAMQTPAPDSSSPSRGAAGAAAGSRKIPFRLVLQTRQEMPLVKLLLDRRKRGQGGDYVSEESYQDLAISAQLPAHYYQEVECCESCYKV